MSRRADEAQWAVHSVLRVSPKPSRDTGHLSLGETVEQGWQGSQLCHSLCGVLQGDRHGVCSHAAALAGQMAVGHNKAWVK